MHRFKLRIDTRVVQFSGEADVAGDNDPKKAEKILRSSLRQLANETWHDGIRLTQTMDDADVGVSADEKRERSLKQEPPRTRGEEN